MSTSSSASTGGNGNGHQSYQPSNMRPLDGVAELAAALQDTTVFPCPQVPMTPQPGIIEISNEAKRMWRLDRLLSELLHGPLPGEIDLRNVRKALDVACGVGGWVHEMAMRYPKMQISGIDKNPYFIAQARLITGGMRNVNFQVQDMLKLGEVPPFKPHSFDLIHLRFVASEIYFEHFASLIKALKRLSKPHGQLVWREAELPITSSPACGLLCGLLLDALQATKRSFAPGHSLALGISVWMRFWLRQAGFRESILTNDYLNISYCSFAHTAFCEQALIAVEQLRPFLLHTGVTTPAEVDEYISHLHKDLADKRFTGAIPIHSFFAPTK
jgi:SAM-dependent methyltransferase